MIIELLLAIVLIIIAFWQRDNVFLYVVAAFTTVVAGIGYLNTHLLIGMCVIGLGCELVYEAIMSAFFRKSKDKNTESKQ